MRPRILIAVLLTSGLLAGPALANSLTLEDVNAAAFADGKHENPQALTIKTQVLLDRAGFSPGAMCNCCTFTPAEAVDWATMPR